MTDIPAANKPRAARSGRSMGRRVDRLGDRGFALLVMLPGLVLVAFVVLPPVLGVLGLSLFRVELLRDDLRTFVGLHNFLDRLPNDDGFLATIPRTVALAAAATLIAVPLALGAALFINSRGRSAGWLGLLLLLPWAVAPIASGIFWRSMFDRPNGLLTGFLGALGIAPLNVPASVVPTLIVTLIAVVWRSIPLLGVLLLAALRGLPRSHQRAARMDGASHLQVFRYVTLPAIRPVLLVVVVLQVIFSLQVFDVFFSITRGQPARGGDLTGYAIFDYVINQLSFGYGSALTVVLAMVVAAGLVLIAIVNRRIGRPAMAGEVADDELARPTVDHLARLRPVAMARSAAASDAAIAPARMAPEPPGVGTDRRRLRAGIGRVLPVALIVVLAIWLVGPMIWLAIASVQPESALRQSPPQLGLRFVFDGYTNLLASPAWQGALVVSLEIAIGATLLALLVATFVAYPLARFRIPGARLLLALLLFTQLIPPIALAIPTLLLFIAFGLKGTVLGLILANAAYWVPLTVWLMRGAFLGVSPAIESAARIDGCGRVGAILRITLPAARPGIAAAAILVFIGVWNDFILAAALGNRATQTMPRFLATTTDPAYHVLAAGILLTILPCVVLMGLMHRRILAVAQI